MPNMPPPHPDNTVRALNNRLNKHVAKRKKKGKTGVKESDLNEICEKYIHALKGNMKKIKQPQKALVLGSKLKFYGASGKHTQSINEILQDLRGLMVANRVEKPTGRPSRAARDAEIKNSFREKGIDLSKFEGPKGRESGIR